MLSLNKLARVRIAGLLLVVLLANVMALAAAANRAPSALLAQALNDPPSEQPAARDPRPEIAFPSPTALAQLKPVDPTELVALRGESHRVFKTDTGYRVEVSTRPVHYQTPDGVFDAIDNTLVSDQKNDFRFRNQAGRFTARFSDTPGAQKVQVEWRGKRFAFGLDETGGPLHSRAAGGQMEFAPRGEGYRIRYQTGPDFLKEEIIIDRYTGKTAWNFPLEVEGLIPEVSPDGRIHLMLAEAVNEAAWTFAPSFAVDAAGERTDNVTQMLHPIGDGQYVVTVQVDPSWLSDPSRQFPVTVDPTVTLDFSDGSRDPGMWGQMKAGATTPMGAVNDLQLDSYSLYRALLKWDLTWIRNLLNQDAGQVLQLSSAEMQLYINAALQPTEACTPSQDTHQCAAFLIAEPLSVDWMMSLVTWDQPRWNGDPNIVAWQGGGATCGAGSCPELPPGAYYFEQIFYPSEHRLTGAPVVVPVTELAQRWLDGFPNYGVRLRMEDYKGTGNVAYFAVRGVYEYGYYYNYSPKLVLNFVTDRTRPSISIQSPAADTHVAGNVTVQVTAGDLVDSGTSGSLSRIDLLIDNNRYRYGRHRLQLSGNSRGPGGPGESAD